MKTCGFLRGRRCLLEAAFEVVADGVRLLRSAPLERSTDVLFMASINSSLAPQSYGDPHRSPRDEKPRTPPGPEGSNGSGGLGRRGEAGTGRRHSCIVIASAALLLTRF